MIKTALERMFKPTEPTTIIATVVKRVSEGKFQLVDDTGREFTAFSSIDWPPQRRVLVQSGRIIQSSTGTAGSIKTYIV